MLLLGCTMNEYDISKASEELGPNGDEWPEMHYCPTSKLQKYWKKDDRGLWIGYDIGAVRRYLKVRCGVKDKELSDEFLCNVENSKVIDVVTKISGYKKGMHRIDGKSVLVPSEQRRIKPVKGDWSTLEAFYLGMLGEEQFEWLKGWKIAHNMIARKHTPTYKYGGKNGNNEPNKGSFLLHCRSSWQLCSPLFRLSWNDGHTLHKLYGFWHI